MKKLITRATTLLSLLAVAACSEEALVENIPTNDGTIKEISITGKDFQFDGSTRSSVTISESGASFTWDEDDVIGIFPNEGDQVSFAMDNGAGTQTATFSGGGWALKSSATYAAYYPHVYENRDMTKIPVSYVGQTQNGNANTDHIGAYDFMAASVATPSNGAVAFDMQHLGCLVQLTITIPHPSTVNKVTLLSDGEFIQNGTINLTSDEIAISPTSVSNTFEIEIETVQTTSEDENIIVYFMLPPTNLSSNTLKVQIATESNEHLEYSLPTRNFVAGKIYALNASKEDLVDNEDVVITGISSNITISKASLKTFVNIPTDVTVYQVGVYVSLEEIPTDSNGSTLATSADSNTETTEFSFQATNMLMNTTYYYRSFVYIPQQAKYYFGEILKFTTQNIDEVTPGEYIDLGLSVKWASHNMGAESQEQIGDRYAWGELTPYSGNYSYESNGSMIDIGNNICGTYYDVAYVRLGDNWRLPTYQEMTELFTNSSYVFTSYKGVIGYLVQGPNGNSIFIPHGNTNFYSGWHTDETGYSYDTYGDFAGFMTGELSTKSGTKGRVYSLMFTDAGTSEFLWYVNGTLSRSVGQSVRPVYTK